MLGISFVIRTLNEIEYLPLLIENIRESEIIADIVVVDSESNDGTYEYASLQSDINLIKIQKENFSFGGAINLGVSKTRFQNVCIISAHCIPLRPNWILAMKITLDEDKNTVAVFCRQIAWKHTNYMEKVEYHCSYKKYSTTVLFSNACSLIKKDILIKHPFDPELISNEDEVWAKQILNLGLQIKYLGSEAVFHSHDENFNNAYNRFRRERIISEVNKSSNYSLKDELKWSFSLLYMRIFKETYSNFNAGFLRDLKYILIRILVIIKMKIKK
jgi:glycosyltransferase involved in cell wall biosynthesis